jgi:hypothetical protein
MEKKYSVFSISPCSCYPIVPGVPSNSDVVALKLLREAIILLKPGHGKQWGLEILEVDKWGSPTPDAHRHVEEIRKLLS